MGVLFLSCYCRGSVLLQLSVCENVRKKEKMYPKRSSGESKRASRPPKRCFHRNKFTEKDEDNAKHSASAKKLSSADSEDTVYNPLHY